MQMHSVRYFILHWSSYWFTAGTFHCCKANHTSVGFPPCASL